jgi:hypothetical protein
MQNEIIGKCSFHVGVKYKEDTNSWSFVQQGSSTELTCYAFPQYIILYQFE